MTPRPVSKKLLMRLPLYLDYLKSLPADTENISATTIAKAFGFGVVQVRKDLAAASPSGRCRTGRNREKLIGDIIQFLDFTTTTNSIVVGAGKLGIALLEYHGFEASGMNVQAGFDIAPEGKSTQSGKPVYPMGKLKTFCQKYNVKIAILTVPEQEAQITCDMLVTCGIRAIWNFTSVYLTVPPLVLVESVDLATSLFMLKDRLRHELAQDS